FLFVRTPCSILFPCTTLFRSLPLGSRLRRLIRADMDLAGFSQAARGEGLRTLRQAGLEKVALGLTTIEEVLSVVPPADESPALPDRKSTRLNSSHVKISYAVF